jgi:hypothetical protein
MKYFKWILLFIPLELFSQHNNINGVDSPLYPFIYLYTNNLCYSEQQNDTIINFEYQLIVPNYNDELIMLLFSYSTSNCSNINLISSKIYNNDSLLFTGFYLNDLTPNDIYIWKLSFNVNTGCLIDYFCPLFIIENVLNVSFKQMRIIKGNIIEFTVNNQINNKEFIIERTQDFNNTIIVSKLEGDYYNLTEKTYQIQDITFDKTINYYLLYSLDYNGLKELLYIDWIDNRDTQESVEYKDINGRIINDLNSYKGIYIEIINKTIVNKKVKL